MKTSGMPRRKPPFMCIVGDYQFQELRIPDEFTINISEKNGDPSIVVFTLTEKYIESQEDYAKREKQVEEDRRGIFKDAKKVSIVYDHEQYQSVVTIIQEGGRASIMLGILKEITLQAKYFAGEEEADWIYENLQVGGD